MEINEGLQGGREGRTDLLWRLAPLASALVVLAANRLIPAALVLSPLSLAVAVLAFRRSERRSALLWLGLTVSLLLNIWLVATIVNIVLNGR